MNKQQKAYALARAQEAALADQLRENEAQFIRSQGIANADGSTPDRLYMIDDEDAFNAACALFESSPLNLYAAHSAAEKALTQAEDALIDYALSIVPAAVRDTLQRGRQQDKIRRQLLDLAFRLDTRTVPTRA